MKAYNIIGFVGYLLCLVTALNYIFPSPLIVLVIFVHPLSMVLRASAWFLLYMERRNVLFIIICSSLISSLVGESLLLSTATPLSVVLVIWTVYSIIELIGYIYLTRYNPIFSLTTMIVPAIIISWVVLNLDIYIRGIEDVMVLVRYIQTIGILMMLSSFSAAIGFLQLKLKSRVSR
ncbi:MAG: hypothetical protein DRP01_08830 [Archaeoglobales archaeon]|nr:MAG: hypothetical protein DRP01_08830 [Archaeoglobales archaeon]